MPATRLSGRPHSGRAVRLHRRRSVRDQDRQQWSPSAAGARCTGRAVPCVGHTRSTARSSPTTHRAGSSPRDCGGWRAGSDTVASRCSTAAGRHGPPRAGHRNRCTAAPTPGDFREGTSLVDVVDRRRSSGGNSASPNGCCVDARMPERYRGEQEPIDPVAGHIPGALNRPWQQNLDTGSALQAADAAASPSSTRCWPIDLPDQVTHQCGSGVTACHNVLAMEVAGLPGSTLYAGLMERVDRRSVASDSYRRATVARSLAVAVLSARRRRRSQVRR